MKQEQVIELLKKHGVFVYETAQSFDMLQTSVNRIASVIAEVEQATLERAAERLDQTEESEPGDVWQPGTPSKVIRIFANESQ